MNVENEWTIAYRQPGESVVHRVLSLHLRWRQAVTLSQQVLDLMPSDTEVYYVTTALYDATNVTEDSFNLLEMGGDDVRVPFVEDGALPGTLADIDPMSIPDCEMKER